MQFEIAIRASQGARRAQEDCALAWPLTGAHDNSATLIDLPRPVPGQAAAVLCDGMGGHAGGAMASRTACEAFLLGLVDGYGTTRQRLYAALEQANGAIAEKVADNGLYKGMGSTLVGVQLDSIGLSWISVGDSLLYFWRDGDMLALNADHSLAPEIDKLAETGKISWAAARADPRRHYLRSALTGDEIEMIDLSDEPVSLRHGDIIVVASDGIHTLEEDSLALIIADYAAKPAAALAQRLISSVDGAHQAHQDNTTIIVIRISDDEAVAGA